MRSGDRACRTGRDATLARSTTIRDRFICRQFQRRQDLCQKEPRSEMLIDEHGTFAVPPDAGLCGLIAFQNRPGINVRFLPSPKAAKKRVELRQLIDDYIVIILTLCIPRDSSRSGGVRPPNALFSLKVIQREDNNRPRAGQNLLRIATLLLRAFHVTHLAMRAFTQPFMKFDCMCGRLARGYATRIKTDLSGEGDKPHFQFCCRNLHDYAVVPHSRDDPGFGFTLPSLLRIATAISSSVSIDVSTRTSAMSA